MRLREMGDVSGEGGPLLIADGETIRGWRGIESDDYDRACRLLEECSGDFAIDINGETGLLWELGGGGTALVFMESENTISLVRVWLGAKTSIEQIAAHAAEDPTQIGEVVIRSRMMCILWSPEDGSTLRFDGIAKAGRPQGDMSVDGSVFAVAVRNGTYVAECEEYEVGDASARRCRLTLRSSPSAG